MTSVLCQLIRRLLREDEGQDLIEYGLLTGIVATSGVVIFTTISSKMADAYSDWGVEIQANWETPAPLPPGP